MDEKKVKVKKWLAGLAANHKEYQKMEYLKLGEDAGCWTCPHGQGVHLHRCARRIAELMELPLSEESVTYEDGETANRINFVYDGVEFFEIEARGAGR